MNLRKLLVTGAVLFTAGVSQAATPTWQNLPDARLQGGLRAFWNVKGGDDALNETEAVRRGFELVDLINTFADYPGRQKENIQATLKGNERNPWGKPPFFERIVRRNIEQIGKRPVLVHDIEFELEQDAGKAWHDLPARKASGARTEAEFRDAYYREWASWYSLPAKWAKEIHPEQPVGIYGPQPFGREYWGMSDPKRWKAFEKRQAGPTLELWKHIDPFVDFYAVSTYFFYESPDSIYYMAANIEENHSRTRQFGDKPVYAYTWLRYHPGGPIKDEREIAPYLAEAAAIVPYFTGARAVVLWGYEPAKKGQYYERLPEFMRGLKRVSTLSEKISAAKPARQPPAKELWWSRKPLIRKLELSPNECVFMGIHPAQSDSARSVARERCGSREVEIPLAGRRATLLHVTEKSITEH